MANEVRSQNTMTAVFESGCGDMVHRLNSIVLCTDVHGVITFMNRHALDFFGYEEKEILQRNVIGTLIPARDLSGRDMGAIVRAIAAHPGIYAINENEHIKKNGERVWVQWTNSVERDATGAVTAILGCGIDITRRKQREDEARRHAAELRTALDKTQRAALRAVAVAEVQARRYKEDRRILDALMEYIPQGVVVTGAHEGKINRVSTYAREHLGFLLPDDPASPEKSSLWGVFYKDGETPSDLYELPQARAARDGEIIANEEWLIRTADGGTLHTVADAWPIRDDENRVIGSTAVWRDITGRKMAEEKIKYISFHDKLTGLYNRSFFEEELRRIDTDRKLPIAFIMGDVNNLKLTNDTFGHQEGDMLLIRIAKILKSCCRSEDLVARWGGDEFVILLPRTDVDTVEEIAGRIRQCCTESPGTIIPPSISLGISVKYNGNFNIYKVLRLAERRMYRSKLMENRGNREAVINALLTRMSSTRPDLTDHICRLQELIRLLGQDMGLTASGVEELAQLASLHDIGNALVSERILRKHGKLTSREWDSVMKHSESGYRIIRSFGELMQAADTVLAHHEQWNGKGYPKGLKGTDIPLPARILSILAAYDAMTHDRFYRRKLSHDEALDELEKCAGKQFDPSLINNFMTRMRQESSQSQSLEMLAGT